MAALSFEPAVALIEGGEIVAGSGLVDPKSGHVIEATGVVLGVIDPAAAVYYDGQITLHYNSDLFNVLSFGWLGDWGADPSLPTLPADSSLWSGQIVNLQAPNSALAASVINNVLLGTLDVDFDWGAHGHAASTAPINIAAVLLQAQTNVLFSLLSFDGSTPPTSQQLGQANLYVSSDFMHCQPTTELEARLCSSGATHAARVQISQYLRLRVGRTVAVHLARLSLNRSWAIIRTRCPPS